MSSNNNGHQPEPSAHNHSLFGSAAGSGVVWAQISLKALDEEMAKLQAMDSDKFLYATGARVALLWLRDGGLAPSEILRYVA